MKTKNKNCVILLSWFMTHNDQECNFQIVNLLGIPQGVAYFDIVDPNDEDDKNTFRCTYTQAKRIANKVKDSINHPTILSIKEFKQKFSRYYPTTPEKASDYESSIAKNDFSSDTNPKHFWSNWDK